MNSVRTVVQDLLTSTVCSFGLSLKQERTELERVEQREATRINKTERLAQVVKERMPKETLL
jgi:hypothetical protein